MNCPTSTPPCSGRAAPRCGPGGRLDGWREVAGTIVSVLQAAADAVEQCADDGEGWHKRLRPPVTLRSWRWRRLPNS
ncbi:hypothetical protein I553_7229 [Mycobacterium xenopi 4042]|uniref:Uncharacterized protein n=1 Tax=Mycobacterium xenopi 4042 TaxID=1299334 RepID=X8E6Q9_MYCXE|nr:hypothetical protein I553_7229 [Mycobacterium xenopi 4042]